MRLAFVVVAVASAVAVAGPKRDASVVRAELDQCKQDVADARQAMFDSKDLLELVDKGKLVVIGPAIVDPQLYAKFLAMKVAAGEIDKKQLKEFIKELSTIRANTLKALKAIAKEDEEKRDKLDAHCRELANELKGGGEGGGAVASDDGLQIWIEIEGAKNVRTVKTMAESAHGAKTSLQSGPTKYTGHAGVNGTLPPGYTLYIVHHSQIWAVLGATKGDFEVSENKGFGAGNSVAVAACIEGGKKGDPYLPMPKQGDTRARCLGGEGTSIELDWKQ